MKRALAAIVVVVGAGTGIAGLVIGRYNALVRERQAVDAQWSQVENVYQRRADLVPNLVAVVQGSAGFEKTTLERVAAARASAGQAAAQLAGGAPTDPAALQRFEQAQAELSSAVSRVIAVVENYPDLKSTQAFRDLQVQLEGSENRIAVERRKFNEAAQSYNTRRNRVPTVWFVGLLGWDFPERPYFAADTAAQTAPAVKM